VPSQLLGDLLPRWLPALVLAWAFGLHAVVVLECRVGEMSKYKSVRVNSVLTSTSIFILSR
jgi:hypothetical protein